MSNPMAKVHERGQEPVDEHQPVLRAGTHGTLPRPRGQLGLVPFMPQQAYQGDEFSDHTGRQPRDPAIADDHRTSHSPPGHGRPSGTRRLTANRARAR